MSNKNFESATTFRGASVREVPKPSLAVTLHPQVTHSSASGYELAMANRHKPWARRWLRTYRPGKFI